MAVPSLEELERALGHRFANPVLAERALTHSSVVAGQSSPAALDNEQFEYLGDALIGFLAAEYLVTTFPNWSEGQLSKGRARLVSAVALSAAGRRLGLGAHLQLGRGEEKTGGREKPALLADAYEAIVAAVYLDGGLGSARSVVLGTLLQSVVAAEGDRLDVSDYKSALQELLQRRGMLPADYRIVREAGPDHRKTFWIEASVEGLSATGTGTSKKEAEQSAAEQLLIQLPEK